MEVIKNAFKFILCRTLFWPWRNNSSYNRFYTGNNYSRFIAEKENKKNPGNRLILLKIIPGHTAGYYFYLLLLSINIYYLLSNHLTHLATSPSLSTSPYIASSALIPSTLTAKRLMALSLNS